MRKLEPRQPRRLTAPALRLFLTAVLHFLLVAVSASRYDQKDNTPVFVIRSEEEAKQVVKLHATSTGEVMYTTVSFTHKGD